jgi:hypothetical protein
MADGVIFRTVDGARWGAAGGLGTGGNLTPLQFDENFWELLTRVQALENDPPEAVSIEDFTVIGSQLEIMMTDGSTRGPFDLPIATFRDVGIWTNDLPLFELDFFSVAGRGFYRTLIAHTTPSAPEEFDPDAIDENSASPTFGSPLYALVYGEDTFIYVIGFFFPGRPGIGIDAGSAIAGHVLVHDIIMPADLTGSEAYLKTDAAGDMEFVIQKNGSDIGTVDFVAGQNEGTFTFADDVEFAAGDRLTVLAPTDGVDTDARELSVTFNATRT